MATQYAFGQIVTSGLVLCLNAGDRNSYPGTGTTWTDLSGNGNNGSLTNGPTFSSANLGTIVFDGVDDYVNCGNSPSIKPSGDMTLSYWFKGVSSSTNVNTGVGTTGFSGVRGYLLGPDSGNNVFFFIPVSSTGLISTSYVFPINTQKWYNITGVYSASSYIKIFLDGVEVASNTNSIPASLYTNNGISLKIGQRGDGFSYFRGSISNTLLYNRALSSQEILQNYNATKTRFGL